MLVCSSLSAQACLQLCACIAGTVWLHPEVGVPIIGIVCSLCTWQVTWLSHVTLSREVCGQLLQRLQQGAACSQAVCLCCYVILHVTRAITGSARPTLPHPPKRHACSCTCFETPSARMCFLKDFRKAALPPLGKSVLLSLFADWLHIQKAEHGTPGHAWLAGGMAHSACLNSLS